MRPNRPVGKPFGELRPGLAAIGRLVDACEAGRFDGGAPAGRRVVLPQGGIADPGIAGREDQVDRAGDIVFMQNVAPRFAAVGGLENAALIVLRIGAAQGGHQHDVGIVRVHPERADVLGVLEADMLPRFPGVGGLVDAVAHVDRAAHHADVAGAEVNDIGIGQGDSHRADGRDRHGIGNGRPDHAAVDGFPKAAAGRAHVIDGGIAGDARHRGDAPGAERPDLAPAHGAVQAGIEGLGGQRYAGGYQKGAGESGRHLPIVLLFQALRQLQ